VEKQSDHDLIRHVCEQDSRAFEVLFARYQEPVRQRLLGMVRDPNTAEDLTQEVFLRVWTHAEQWNGRGPFKAWVLRIATNLALNHLRTVRRRRELPLELPAEPTEESELTPVPIWMIDTATRRPEEALVDAEQCERLQRLLEELSEDKREVFRLIHDAELEVREVAANLGIPEGTVRSRLHYAKKQLAREWHSHEEKR